MLYADVPWLRRRSLHRQLAEAMERAGAQSREIATHWRGAREDARAREALLRAAEEAEAVHAYRDAAAADRQVLDLWPEHEEEGRRLQALERYGRCSHLAGDLAEAARAWREVAEVRRSAGEEVAMADAQRSLAAIHELRGDRESAFAARRVATEAYAANGRPAEASVEQLAMANYLRLAARHGAAIELARAAREQADAAGRLDLRIRALGLEGLATAKHGEYGEGLEIVRGGLALALEHDLTPIAAELYQRLSVVLYDSADYRRAQDALDHGARPLPCQRRRRHGARVRDLHDLRAARPRRLEPRGGDEPRADRRRYRGVRRAGVAGRDPCVPGQARLRPQAPGVLARPPRRGSTTTT